MAGQKKAAKGGNFREPHDYKELETILDPLFKGEIDYLIRMIRMREIYAIELMLEPVGLTLSAWYPLTVLRVEDGMSQRELGTRLNLKDAAIGKAIDALERAGLVNREKDPDDRRKALVCLTGEGKKIARSVEKMRKKFQAAVIDGFSEQEKDLFRDLLERSYENIGKLIASQS
ncbi:MarR family winged helix-turn-helix transcriptional regulator [Niveispirillum fermenti]|uniref:MarR family winged helix-turn-helix transcriptional regulator n=1 Tax=Niveispirillum fermenti TaxID=1233113 RepID=UPI003A89D1D6